VRSRGTARRRTRGASTSSWAPVRRRDGRRDAKQSNQVAADAVNDGPSGSQDDQRRGKDSKPRSTASRRRFSSHPRLGPKGVEPSRDDGAQNRSLPMPYVVAGLVSLDSRESSSALWPLVVGKRSAGSRALRASESAPAASPETAEMDDLRERGSTPRRHLLRPRGAGLRGGRSSALGGRPERPSSGFRGDARLRKG
jgi:hypothetical protein